MGVKNFEINQISLISWKHAAFAHFN